MQTPAAEMDPQSFYSLLRNRVDALLQAFPGQTSERVRDYFAVRAGQPGAIKQDLLPLLTFLAVSQGADYGRVLPAVTTWALYLAASHLFDEAQDGQDMGSVNAGIAAIGWATMSLGQLEADSDTLADILNALGSVTVLGSTAQQEELLRGRTWPRAAYLSHIAGKSATIIATGIWLGGRLATEDAATLRMLRELGLALGMAIQLADDCLDLSEDLRRGIYTLPVVEALSRTEHPEYATLQQLTTHAPLTAEQIETLIALLERMGVINKCQSMVRAYQTQAAAILDLLPDLKPYFASYIA